MSATDLAAIATISATYLIAFVFVVVIMGRSIRRLDRAVRQFHDAVEDLHTTIDRLPALTAEDRSDRA